MKTLILCLFFSLFIITGYSQSVFQYIEDHKEEIKNLGDYWNTFNEWSEQVDLENTKGWKNIKRKLENSFFLLNPEGELPTIETFNQSLNAVEQAKSRTRTQQRSTAWTPVGPYQPPVLYDTLIEIGVGRINCITFHPSDPDIFWVGTPSGGIWETINHGLSWTPIGEGIPVPGVSDIAVDPTNPNILYVSTGDYAYFLATIPQFTGSVGIGSGAGIYKTTNGGLTWEATGLSAGTIDQGSSTLIREVIINPANSNELIAGGYSGIWKSTDGGDNWTNIVPDVIIADLEQHPVNPNIIFATTSADYYSGSTLVRTQDFGENWNPVGAGVLPNQSIRMSVEVSDANSDYVYLLAVNNAAGLEGFYQSTNGGNSWALKHSGQTRNLLGWWFGDPDTDGSGQGWYDLTLLTDPQDPEKVIVGGINQWVSTDGGSDWYPLSFQGSFYGNNIHVDQHQAKYNPLSEEYYFCNDGGLFMTNEISEYDFDSLLNCTADLINCLDSLFAWNSPDLFTCLEAHKDSIPFCFQTATEWTFLSSGINNTEFYRIDVANSDPEYILGGSQDNAVYYKSPSGWTNHFVGDGMDVMIHPTDPAIIYGSNQNGVLNFSLDGGLNEFNRLTSDIIDEGAVSSWITPFVLNEQNPSTVYGGYEEIYRSTDGGFNWELYTNLLSSNSKPIRDLIVHPTDSNYMVVLKSANFFGSNISGFGEVHYSQDNGQSWDIITGDLPDLDVFFSSVSFGTSPQHIILTCAGFEADKKVYQTFNGGDDWENISFDLPNIPVICSDFHIGSADSIIYIGTYFGIYYTNRNMDSWEPYNEELPEIMIRDLDIQYGSNKIYAGTYGRGIWYNDLVPPEVVNTETPAIYDMNVSIVPNPNTGQFNLQLEQVSLLSANLEIVDVLGRKVYEQPLKFQGQQHAELLSLDLLSGIYYLRLTDGKYSNVQKFVVK